MATEAERQNILSGITPATLLQLLEFYGGQQQAAPFIDIDRQKLMAKFAPNTGAGAALRSAYQAIDAGADPQAVLDNFMAQYDSGELDSAMADSGLTAITPDEASEVVSAIGGSAIAKQKQAASAPKSIDVLKDLGMPELGFLLPAAERSVPKMREFTPQPQLQALQAKLQKELETQAPKAKERFTLDEALGALRQAQGGGASIGAGAAAALKNARQKDFSVEDVGQILSGVQGVGSEKFQKQQRDRMLQLLSSAAGKPEDVAKYQRTQEELAKAKKTAAEMAAFEAGGRKVYEENFKRLAQKAMGVVPTQFDIMKALMMRSKG